MMKYKVINNEVVKPIKTPDDLDKRTPRGQQLISAPYCNIFLCAKKRTGKSSVVSKMVKKFAGPDTHVHVFCSTAFIDPTYIELGQYLDAKGIPYYASTSIKDENGYDLIDDILKEDEDMINPADDEDEKQQKPKIKIINLDPDAEKPKRKRRSKFKELHRIIICDDLSNEITNSVSLKRLLKMHRHIKSKVLISSQYLNDLAPQSISQLDYTFLFKGHNDKKLEELHKKLDISLDLPDFINMYRTVTGDKKAYNFLYITRFEEFRKNFNQLIILEEN